MVLRSALAQELLVSDLMQLFIATCHSPLIEDHRVLLFVTNVAFTSLVVVVRNLPFQEMIDFEETFANILVLPRILVEDQLRQIRSPEEDILIIGVALVRVLAYTVVVAKVT